MPEQLREQLETAINKRLQDGAQRPDFGSFLIPTSLLQEWYERTNVPSVYRDIALTDEVCLEVGHQKKKETKISFLERILDCTEFKAIRLGVCTEGSNSYREAHRLILNSQQRPLLVHTARVGRSELQNRPFATGIDLEYFLRFVQQSEAFAPGTLRLIR